ncbi:MAG: 4Fe-4S ferredoxin iron-sulfur binding protein [Gammaproteobacteria bacterium]|nr:MAG: 4Fe-4S ferredoxin iron-sulfur binding protein [Gammaproteobacteria bacterium]TND05021.1 MAG: 4Fe-4S ferredoxin, iron-sulfur binding protein [Gammaproteobacteria bacterium]
MSALQDLEYLVYFVPLLLIWAAYFYVRTRRQRKNIAARDNARIAGLMEPASLHPVVDPLLCIGCGSCVSACPEDRVLGVISRKAELINPASCIGHGACREACPEGAITLVFGSEARGVDIPLVKHNFETNVPGIFIAGELGGMGLIRNAIEQGRQAITSIAKLAGIGKGDRLDVVIVGAGPAGIAASLAAMQLGLRYANLEQGSLGGTVAHYPRGKIVMTAPVELPIIGKVKLIETSKEALLAFWQGIERQTGLKIRYHERVDGVEASGDGFVVRTTKDSYHTRAVLLAIGRRGTPRPLEVAGEQLPKVVYRLIDPEQYRGLHVLVVGGGDSALEAALSLAGQPGTTVTLSYRSAAFSRAKEKNRQRIEQAAQEGRMTVLLQSTIQQINPADVRIEHDGRVFALPNDAVIICAGGILPTSFLQKLGIQVETKYGTA